MRLIQTGALTSLRPPEGRTAKCICSGDGFSHQWLAFLWNVKACEEQKTDKRCIVSVRFSVSSAMRRLNLDRNPTGSSQNGAKEEKKTRGVEPPTLWTTQMFESLPELSHLENPERTVGIKRSLVTLLLLVSSPAEKTENRDFVDWCQKNHCAPPLSHWCKHVYVSNYCLNCCRCLYVSIWIGEVRLSEKKGDVINEFWQR